MSAMRVPYNRALVDRGIIYAARAGRIFSFNVHDGTHIATWNHPDVEASIGIGLQKAEDQPPQTQKADADGGEPPSKRQKVDDSQKDTSLEQQLASDETAAKKSQNRKRSDNSRQAQVPNQPIITHLALNSRGSHLVAVSGHDKSIWAFSLDGSGHLESLGKRAMPKRPIAIRITPDDKIITADKFGDVYSLPLIDEALPVTTEAERHLSGGAAKPQPNKPAANTFTVHSQRNLRALEHQLRVAELKSNGEHGGDTAKQDEPKFELQLLLGHVSMLTDLVLATHNDRPYIITADRDEHIRVSRSIPQTHVIEGYCAGHEEFISALHIPATRPELLVSGGGDSELFVWDWKAASLSSKASALDLAREVAPSTTKIAVLGIHSLVYPSEGEGSLLYVLAICEGVKAIFSWRLTDDNMLNCPSIIQLPGNPLDVSVVTLEDKTPRLVVVLDPIEGTMARSLNVYALTLNDGNRLGVGECSAIHDSRVESDVPEVSEKELRALLYATEPLRKHRGAEEGGDDDAQEKVAGEAS